MCVGMCIVWLSCYDAQLRTRLLWVWISDQAPIFPLPLVLVGGSGSVFWDNSSTTNSMELAVCGTGIQIRVWFSMAADNCFPGWVLSKYLLQLALLEEMDPSVGLEGGGICMNPKGFTLVPVTALCAGLCTSATLSCGVKMSESSSCIICCPSMLWIFSASPTPSLTQVSQPVSVSLFVYTNMFSNTGQSGVCVCLSVCFCTLTCFLTQVSQLSVCFCTPTPSLTQVSQPFVSVCFCTPTPSLTQVSRPFVSVHLHLL